VVQAKAYAEQEFNLSAIQKDGKTLREHLEAVERLTKKKPKELIEQVELPESMSEYWEWFTALNKSRSSGFGASPITYTEMVSYFSLIGIEPEKWEIDIVKMFDSIALSSAREQEEKNKTNNK
jgi:hypothetical protein